MNKDEILRYIHLGRNKSVIIDRCILPEYCGFVRETTILENNIVVIEFSNYGYDEGGIKYYIEFRNMDELISSLQEYLSKDISIWENINKTGYYPEPTLNCSSASTNSLIEDFIHDLIVLPKDSLSIKIPEGYWKSVHDGQPT